MASTTIEEIAEASCGTRWFQLFMWKDAAVVTGMIERARECGYRVLVVTIDTPISSKRDRDWRNGFTLPLRLRFRDRLEAVRHVHWMYGYLRSREITFVNLADAVPDSRRADVLGKLVNETLANPGATWEDLARVREIWNGPLVVKGVLSVADARRAADCGANGIVVSNHGGRQLDHAPPSIDVLPQIAAAVGDQIDVLLDSGVRRGSDVVKAIALGARAVLVGRPYLWGLAAAGQSGAEYAIEILSREIDLCMALVGRASLSDLDPSLIRGAACP